MSPRRQALEKALLSFHTSKMADINTIVKELWQKTYRNSDIDYIQVGVEVAGGCLGTGRVVVVVVAVRTQTSTTSRVGLESSLLFSQHYRCWCWWS